MYHGDSVYTLLTFNQEDFLYNLTFNSLYVVSVHCICNIPWPEITAHSSKTEKLKQVKGDQRGLQNYHLFETPCVFGTPLVL